MPLRGRIASISVILAYSIANFDLPNKVVRPTACYYLYYAKAHNTRQASIERLDEAVAALTRGHAELNNKLESIMDRLATLTIPPPLPKTPPTPPLVQIRPHMKLDVPRFDDQDTLGWIFKILQFFDLTVYPRSREAHCISLLYGRSCFIMVPVDVSEWFPHLL